MEIKSRHIVKYQNVTEVKRTASRLLRKKITDAETVLWTSLRGSALGVKFRRQQVIQGFIVDFYCDSLGLIVEADGGVHLENPENNYERDALFIAHNLTILHFANSDILTNLSTVLEEIRRVKKNLTPDPSP